MGNKIDCHKARRHSKQDEKAELMKWEEEVELDARWAYESELLDVFYAIHGREEASDSYTNDSLPDGITFQS